MLLYNNHMFALSLSNIKVEGNSEKLLSSTSPSPERSTLFRVFSLVNNVRIHTYC